MRWKRRPDFGKGRISQRTRLSKINRITWHDSQLYHIDYYSLPNVYVLVLLRDTSSENGPWTFLPRSVTKRVSSKLRYWTKEHGYRLTDDQVYSVAKRDEV